MEIDIYALRAALMDYYGTAVNANPMAIFELGAVERASAEELIEIAESLGWI